MSHLVEKKFDGSENVIANEEIHCSPINKSSNTENNTLVANIITNGTSVPAIQKPEERTSSALLYSEYINTTDSKHLGHMFEKKTAKPLITPVGESPLYKKYSELLKQLKECKDEDSPTQENSPIVEMEILLKKQETDSDSDSDINEGRFVFYNGNHEDSSDDNTSDEDEEKPNTKVEIVNEDSSPLKLKKETSYGGVLCNMIKRQISSIDSPFKEESNEPKYEQIAKKAKLK